MKKTKTGNIIDSRIKELVKSTAPRDSVLKYGEGENELTIKVYPVLTFTKRTEMIRTIIDGVFMDKKDSINSYAPEYLDFWKRYSVIKYFTDFELPEKLDDAWLILNYTPIYGDVIDIVGDYVAEIFTSADNAIMAYKQYLATKTDSNMLINKLGELLKDFENLIPQKDIEAITSKIKSGMSLQDIFGSLIGNNDSEENT